MVKKSVYRKKNSDTFHRTNPLCLETDSAESTEKLGRRLAEWLRKHNIGCVVFTGPFGSGKTTMIRGIIKNLTGRNDVSSPSFTIVNEYSDGKVPVYHFDFYRIKNSDELESFGFREYADKGLLLIEWPEAVLKNMPAKSLRINIEFLGLNRRKITITFPEEI